MQNRYTPQEVRKTITTVLKSLSQIKIKTFEEVKQMIINNLKEFPGDIREILSDNNETLAHITVKEDKYDSFRLIIESYISILGGLNENFFGWFLQENAFRESVLELCAQKGNQQIIKYIHNIIIKTSETKFRITDHRSGIFHHAAQNNQCYPIIFFYEKLQNFYKEHLIIDIPNEYGITPLHYACIKGSKQVMDLLLDLGVNLNAVDSENNTCLHYAVMSRNKRVVKKLLVRGANRDKINKEGKTPFDLAIENGDNDIADLLFIKRKCFNLCISADNIETISGNRNDSSLLFAITFIILFKFIYTYRLNYIYLGSFKTDILPYIENLVTDNVEINVSSFRDLFNNSECPYTKNCYLQIIIAVASMIFDYFVLGVVVYFMCCGMTNYIKKKSKNKTTSLIELYEKSKYVCVKCRNVVDASTVHCFICNACVKDFQHHCFWLNTCINKRNIKLFNVFVYGMLVCLIGNCMYFAMNVLMVDSWSDNGEFEKVMFECGKSQAVRNVWKLLNAGIVVVCFYFVIVMVLPMVLVDVKYCCNKKKKKSQLESKLIRGNQQLIDGSLEQLG